MSSLSRAVVSLALLVAVLASGACADSLLDNSASPLEGSRAPLESLRLHSTPGSVPLGWADAGAVPPDQPLVLTLALRLRNADMLQQVLQQVSEPSSPTYGRYLTAQEANALVAPEEGAVAAVMEWVVSVPGVELLDGEATHSGMIRVRLPARSAEELLDTRFRFFRSLDTGKVLARAHDFRYTVPSDVAPHLDFVGGVVRLPDLSSASLHREAAFAQEQADSIKTTPSFIHQMYNVSTNIKEERRNLQAIVSFLEQYISLEDLAKFMDANKVTPRMEVEKIIGPNDISEPGVEASLDIQYLMGVAYGIRTWVWSTAGRNEFNQEPFMDWLHNVTSSPEIPYVFSISYQDLEDTLGPEYMKRVDMEFQKLGARGITLFTGSGDWGVGNITTPDGGCARFRSDFPSSSPHIVSAGATYFTTLAHEYGVTFSSGGFSEEFSRPSWQQAAISKFLSKTATPSYYFNALGRGFPDLSAVGTNFQVYVGGVVRNVGGTSASTPTIASLISLMNSERLRAGKPALGFVNPFLYSAWEHHPDSFKDITVGNNKFGPCPGFDCTEGWDAMTGLGVPNWAVLSKLAMDAKMFPSFAEER